MRVLFTTISYWLVLWVFRAVDAGTAMPLVAVSTAAGVCWAAFMLALAANVTDDGGFLSLTFRLVIMPMFLFSGTFYPLSSLPLVVRWIGWISPLWHATELGRWLSYGQPMPAWQATLSVVYLASMGAVSFLIARRRFERRLTA